VKSYLSFMDSAGSMYKKFLKAMFFVGFGVALYDYLNVVCSLGGYKELVSVQVGYIGFIIMYVVFRLIIMKEGETAEEREENCGEVS